jgi:hypothetical protein
MRLRDRLANLAAPMAEPAVLTEPTAKQSTRDVVGDHDQRIARLRSLIGEVAARTALPSRVPAYSARGPQLLPVGASRATPQGTLHVIERWLDKAHCHGRVAVCDALAVDAALVARLALDAAFEGVDLTRLLIIDTETTGLAGGSGTVPFLIGLAFFDEGVLKVEQLFLQDLGGEAPLLQHLRERIAQASCIVSYNGKAFDWPLLRTRFILNRIALPELGPHLDLLHCCRRLLRARMPSVRLTDVEQELLGFYREDDIDGADIPGLYLAYLRGEDPSTLLPVITHNVHDLVALAAILSRLCAHFADVAPHDDPRDHLAYARVAFRASDFERVGRFAEAAVRGSDSTELAVDALSLLALVARRRGDSLAAESAWQRALVAAGTGRAAARVHLALARLYERQLKDPGRAHRHARFTFEVEGAEAHGRRLGRLRRRIERLAISG